MEWHSKKIEHYYRLVSKIVGNALHNQYPDLKYFKIGEESFNELFNPNISDFRVLHIDIILCVDFTSLRDNSNIGISTMSYINNAIMSVDNSIFTSYSDQIYTDKFLLNKTQYCKGLIPLTVE
jgi:hypothetical protein